MSPWTPTVLQWTTRRTPAAGRGLDQRPHRRRRSRARYVAVAAGRPADTARRCCRRPRRRATRRAHERARRARSPRTSSMPASADRRRARRSRTSARTCVAARRQRAREVPAREAGRAGDEDAHRSATTVTGDPSSRSRPARASAPSIRSVAGARVRAACAARSAARTGGARRATRKPVRARARARSARAENTRYASTRRAERVRDAPRRPPAAPRRSTSAG